MAKTFTGAIHNAKRVTFDGRDCFVAAVIVDGRFKADEPGDIVSEHATLLAAKRWMYKELRNRGVRKPHVVVEVPTIEVLRG